MFVTLTICKGALGQEDGLVYGNGERVKWADFIIDEPDFVMPKGAQRIEYIPNERLSYFKDGSQFGEVDGLNQSVVQWDDGDRFIARKDEYVANALARIPAPPDTAPAPTPVNTKAADAKVAIDNYLVNPAADEKMKTVLQAIREAL